MTLLSDYNYERQSDNSCALVPGLTAHDPIQQCRDDPNLVEYYVSKGYRRIPLDTCEGGLTLDKVGESFPCPGHEADFASRHGLHGFWLFVVAVLLPVGLAAAAGWYVYTRWGGKFGAIRLGESSGGVGGVGSAFDADRPWVRWPVAVLSGVVAVVAAVPLVLGAGWRFVSGLVGRRQGARFDTRQSFARGREGYAVVEDDDELLGEDEDEEV